MNKTKPFVRLWVVVKVLKETHEMNHKLNLSNSDSSSIEEEETRSTYEIQDPYQEFSTHAKPNRATETLKSPRLTLVFMAYEKKPDKSGENLVNVSHLASKFA